MTAHASPLTATLTPEQKRVAEAPPTDRILVTAGPGTGKTHVLIARLAVLIDRHGLSPGHELLVLSFSRAAVREIRNRTAAAAGDVRYVRAQTFDSFATHLLAEFRPDGPWATEDYDGRIRCATALVREDEDARGRVAGYTHVLVDEVQDLVGERAVFVQAILEASWNGFTLLGDPAQGIYNFQLEGAARRDGSAALYRWLRTRFKAGLIECALTENHRAKTPAAKKALWAGPLLNQDAPDYGRIKYHLETVIAGLPTLGRLESVAGALRRPSARTAVLCRDNGQVLMISRHLWSAGVPHRLQGSATDRALPPWIGILFGNLEQRSIGKAAFTRRAADALGPSSDPETVWRALKRIDGRPTDTLDIGLLAERIRTGNMPDDLCEAADADLVLSTIHRAKGLEFDRVVVIDARIPDDGDDPCLAAEEARVLYVALTRPKTELYHLEVPPFKGLSLDQDLDRWFRRFAKWQIVDFEVQAEDVHREDPAGGFLLKNADPPAVQEYIRSEVKPGDAVTLTRCASSDSGAPRVFYAVEHNGRTVGVTSEWFGALLYRKLKISRTWTVNWPARIENLRVSAVDTVAGTEAAGKRCRLGASGIWLRVRVAGLGCLRFEKSSSD